MRYFLIFLLPVVLLMAEGKDESWEGYTRFSDPHRGYAVRHPDDWSHHTAREGEYLHFSYPPEKYPGLVTATLYNYKFYSVEDTFIRLYSQICRESMTALEDYTIVSKGKEHPADGVTLRWRLVSYLDGDRKMMSLVYGYGTHDDIYVFEFHLTDEGFNQNSRVIEKIARSFEFIGKMWGK